MANDNAGTAADDRRARMDFLLRRQRGEPQRSRLGQFLAEMKVTESTLLPLDESDAVAAQLFLAVRSARANEELASAMGLAAADFRSLAERLLSTRPSDEVATVALTNVSELGVLMIAVSALKNVLGDLLDFDRDSVIAAGPELSWGLIAQRVEHDQENTYDLETWGLKAPTDQR
jgi:hypothetical protein